MLVHCSEGIISVFPGCSRVCLLFLASQSSDQVFPLSGQTPMAKVVMNSTDHTDDLLLKMLSPPQTHEHGRTEREMDTLLISLCFYTTTSKCYFRDLSIALRIILKCILKK